MTSTADWLGVQDLVRVTGLSERHVKNLIEGGALPATNFAAPGAQRALWRVKRANFNAFTEQRSNAAPVKPKRRRREAGPHEYV